MVRMLTHADHVRQASVYNDDLVGNMGSIIIKHKEDAVKAFGKHVACSLRTLRP